MGKKSGILLDWMKGSDALNIVMAQHAKTDVEGNEISHQHCSICDADFEDDTAYNDHMTAHDNESRAIEENAAEEARIAEEYRVAAEQKQNEEENALADEEARIAEEYRVAAEQKQNEEENALADEEARIAEEYRVAAEQKQNEEENALADEEARIAEAYAAAPASIDKNAIETDVDGFPSKGPKFSIGEEAMYERNIYVVRNNTPSSDGDGFVVSLERVNKPGVMETRSEKDVLTRDDATKNKYAWKDEDRTARDELLSGFNDEIANLVMKGEIDADQIAAKQRLIELITDFSSNPRQDGIDIARAGLSSEESGSSAGQESTSTGPSAAPAFSDQEKWKFKNALIAELINLEDKGYITKEQSEEKRKAVDDPSFDFSRDLMEFAWEGASQTISSGASADPNGPSDSTGYNRVTISLEADPNPVVKNSPYLITWNISPSPYIEEITLTGRNGRHQQTIPPTTLNGSTSGGNMEGGNEEWILRVKEGGPSPRTSSNDLIVKEMITTGAGPDPSAGRPDPSTSPEPDPSAPGPDPSAPGPDPSAPGPDPSTAPGPDPAPRAGTTGAAGATGATGATGAEGTAGDSPRTPPRRTMRGDLISVVFPPSQREGQSFTISWSSDDSVEHVRIRVDGTSRRGTRGRNSSDQFTMADHDMEFEFIPMSAANAHMGSSTTATVRLLTDDVPASSSDSGSSGGLTVRQRLERGERESKLMLTGVSRYAIDNAKSEIEAARFVRESGAAHATEMRRLENMREQTDPGSLNFWGSLGKKTLSQWMEERKAVNSAAAPEREKARSNIEVQRLKGMAEVDKQYAINEGTRITENAKLDLEEMKSNKAAGGAGGVGAMKHPLAPGGLGILVNDSLAVGKKIEESGGGLRNPMSMDLGGIMPRLPEAEEDAIFEKTSNNSFGALGVNSLLNIVPKGSIAGVGGEESSSSLMPNKLFNLSSLKSNLTQSPPSSQTTPSFSSPSPLGQSSLGIPSSLGRPASSFDSTKSDSSLSSLGNPSLSSPSEISRTPNISNSSSYVSFVNDPLRGKSKEEMTALGIQKQYIDRNSGYRTPPSDDIRVFVAPGGAKYYYVRTSEKRGVGRPRNSFVTSSDNKLDSIIKKGILSSTSSKEGLDDFSLENDEYGNLEKDDAMIALEYGNSEPEFENKDLVDIKTANPGKSGSSNIVSMMSNKIS